MLEKYDDSPHPAAALSVAGGGSGSAPAASALLPIDWNRDFRQDLVFAGAGGVRLFLQNSDGTFPRRDG